MNNIFYLSALTILFTMIVVAIIIMCKDIKKQIKNKNFSNEVVIKLRMLHVAMLLCALIFFVILLFEYLSFFKIV